MTTYCRDGERFEVNGIEFEAIEDRESHYRGFRCIPCDELFAHDPSDHYCEPKNLCGLCGMRSATPPNTACGVCA